MTRRSDGSHHGQPHHGHGHAHHAHGSSGPHHAFAGADAWTQRFDDPARDEWQYPDEVLRALELQPALHVADVGAGTGYFAVRLARALPRGQVLATDLEPDMVRFLDQRARREHLPNLRAVQATPAASGLAAATLDRILIVHVWHHVSARVEYVRDLAAALKAGGRLLIVEFSPESRVGPPSSMRLAPEAVMAELDSAGLSTGVSRITLPDQYIIEAHRRG
jgi:SAM-dependent methyltransferase